MVAVGLVAIAISIDVAFTAFGAAGNSEDFTWFILGSNLKVFKLLVLIFETINF